MRERFTVGEAAPLELFPRPIELPALVIWPRHTG